MIHMAFISNLIWGKLQEQPLCDAWHVTKMYNLMNGQNTLWFLHARLQYIYLFVN